MELIWSTKELILKARNVPDFPILLDDHMVSVWPANAFLRYHLLQRGRVESPKSWPAYGQTLYDYFGFLQANDLAWDSPGGPQEYNAVGAYRDYSLQLGLARNTVRQRLYIVGAFYEYALEQKWIVELPFSRENVSISKGPGLLAHTASSGEQASSRTVLPKKRKDLPKFLSAEQARSLLAVASNPHHRMLVSLALRTGLRRAELATFPCSYVLGPAQLPTGQKHFRICLDPYDGSGMQTKGGKKRTIRVSRVLMQDLWHYLISVRGLRIAGDAPPCGPLLLNQNGEPFAKDGRGISKIVAQLGKRAGFRAWPHILRHTYATQTLHVMQQKDSTLKPLLFLMRQLGHDSIETTMIYAHLIDEVADSAVLAYDEEVSSWSAG